MEGGFRAVLHAVYDGPIELLFALIVQRGPGLALKKIAHYAEIHALKVGQGPLGRRLGYGNIILTTADASSFKINNIDDPDAIAARIDERIQQTLVQQDPLAFNNMVGVEYRRFIDLEFYEQDGKTVRHVYAWPANRPIFLRENNAERFYMRAGNASQPLTFIQVVRYIQARFPQC